MALPSNVATLGCSSGPVKHHNIALACEIRLKIPQDLWEISWPVKHDVILGWPMRLDLSFFQRWLVVTDLSMSPIHLPFTNQGEIARRRNLSTDTVMGHLADALELGHAVDYRKGAQHYLCRECFSCTGLVLEISTAWDFLPNFMNVISFGVLGCLYLLCINASFLSLQLV